MRSLWFETEKTAKFKSLDNNIETDVCIIGAGIFGLTSAYYLSKKGLNTVIIDRNEIAHGVTGHTTAKITSQHGLIYKYLIDSFGLEMAKQYLEANEEAIKNIETIIKNEQIDCDFEKQNSYVYTTNENEIVDIKNEITALHSLGFESEFTTQTSLSFEIKGAIKFSNQAQFNPIKYSNGLSQKIIENNGKIYTNTTIYSIEKDTECYLINTEKNTIKAKYVILATHYPFIDRAGYYFLKMYQSTSYTIAVDTHEKNLDEMYINPKPPIYSYRTAKFNDKNLLLVTGSDYKTGTKQDLKASYKNLENEVKKYYPKSEILFRWNTEDCISLDKIPYIGEFSKLMPNIYVGTGFNKWGMTSSNVASKIITDMILGKQNKYEDVFKSTRLEPMKNHEELKNMLSETAKSFVIKKLEVPKQENINLETDSSTIIEINGEKIGIYKDTNGKIFPVKVICSHLGCLLSWNNLDKTWDCPCHGSRYDYMGNLLYGPGVLNLEKRNLENTCFGDNDD